MTSIPVIPPPRSLPFPAGPLLRPATAAASELAASAHQRKQFALAVLRREYEAVHKTEHPISKLTGLMAQAVLDWAAHEPQHAAPLASPTGEGCHPAAKLLLQWKQGAPLRTTKQSDAENAAAIFFGDNLNARWRHQRDVAWPWLPHPLTAGTSQAAVLTAEPRTAQVAGDISPEVATVLAEPGGGWRLLGCTFLKLLHGELAWLPTLTHKSEFKQALYEPALQLLQQMARSNAAQRGTAAGLVLALPRIAPYWEPENAGAWRPVDLPACFRPDLLQPQAAVLKQASRLLAHRPGLAKQLDAVQALAQDVAALMTDLPTEPGLGLSAAHHAQRQSHLHSGGKQWGQALKKPDDERMFSLRTSKDFARDHLLPRRKQLLVLATWMATRGCAFAHQAAHDNALPLPPRPTSPAAARPAAGELS